MIGPIPSTWEVDVSVARATPVVPGLWRLRLPSAYWHIDHSNAWLVEGPDGATLVDCGSGGHPSAIEALERALAETGHSVADVAELVLTHHHSDHVGAAAWVAERSGCRVWLHPGHAHFTAAATDPEGVARRRREAMRRAGAEGELLEMAASIEEEQQAVEGLVAADVDLVDGTEVPTGLGTWRALETPGHAPSHVSLHLPERRLLISGDLIFAAFSPHYDYGWTRDPVGEYLGSLRRIGGLDLEAALPGHGRPMTSEEIAAAVSGHAAAVRGHLDAVLAAVAREERTACEVMAEVFPEDLGTLTAGWRIWDTLAYLRHLRLQGAVVRREGPDGRDRYAAAAPVTTNGAATPS